MRTHYVSITSLLLAISLSSVARASCVPPRFNLVWSSPADGDSDVPLDASLQLLTTTKRHGTWQATLNDAALSGDSPEQFALGALEPNTDYTFRLVSTDRHTRIAMPAIEVKFRTGSSHAVDVAAPRVASSRIEPKVPAMSEQCQAAFHYEACYDGLPTQFRSFDLDSSAAVAYLVAAKGGAPRLWPAGCEPLALERTAADSGDPVCYEVTAIDARGNRSEVTEHCTTRAAQHEQAIRAKDAATCSVQRIGSSPASGWLGLACIGLFAVFSGRRRAR